MRRRIVLMLAVAAFVGWAAAAAAGVRLEGVVFTEGPAECVAVQVWALGGQVLDQPARLTTPLYDAVAAPGKAFAIELDKAELPVWVQASAEGHVALGMAVVLEEQEKLPPAYLRRGEGASLKVLVPGKAAAGAVAWGALSPGSWSETPDRWRPVVPVSPVPGNGRLPVVLPADGCRAELVAVTAQGAWSRRRRATWRPGETAVLSVDSRPLKVRALDRRGKPVAGVLVAAQGAPRGAAARTGADGRATVEVPARGSWTLVAVGKEAAAGLSGGDVAKEAVLNLEPGAEVELSWDPALGPLALAPDWLPEALGLTPAPARGGRARLPWPGRGGWCRVWGPGVAQRLVEVAEAGKPVPLPLQKAVTVEGRVLRPGGESAAGLPVWLHLPQYFTVSGRSQFRGLRTLPLERPWLPWAVTDAAGGFRVGALPAGGVQAEVRAPGLPPARSERLDPKPGETLRLEIELRPGATVKLRALSPEGDPVAGATVDVYRQEKKGDSSGAHVFRFGPVTDERGDPDASAVTDAEGRVAVRQVPVGLVRVVLRAEGYVTRTLRDVEVPEEGADLADVELEPSATLRGVTVGPDGRPVGGAEVALSQAPEMPFFIPSAVSDEEGRFEIPGLERGAEVYVQGRAQGYVPKPLKKVTLPADGEVRVEMAREKVLTGRVVEKGTGEPLAGATVTAMKRGTLVMGGMQVMGVTSAGSTPAGEDGRFELGGLAPGRYEIQVSAEGHRDAVRTVILEEASEPAPLTIEMERGLELRGRVVDPGGAPVAGAHVRAMPGSLGQGAMVGSVQETRSGGDGTFVIQGLGEGRYTLEAEDDEGRRGTAMAEAGGDQEVVIELSDGTTLRGRVVDEEGTPVSGARVRVWGMGTTAPPVTTGPDGRFELTPLFPGSYVVSAGAEGYAGGGENVTVPESGEPEEVTLTLHRGGVVTGRVTGLSAAKLEQVEVWSANRSWSVDGQGRFRLEGVPFGTQQVTAMVMPAGGSRSVTVEVPEDGTPAEVTIDFSQGATLTGRVTRGGEPLPGLVVTAAAVAEASGRTTVTGEDGGYRLEGLDPGEYQVAVKDGSGQVLGGEHVVMDGDAVLDIELPSAAVSGWVLEDGTERPLAGATVTVRAAGLPPVERVATSNEDGSFAVEDLPPGEVTVEARAQGYTPAQRPLTLDTGAPAQVTLHLVPEDVLRLRVSTAPGGAPSSLYVTPLVFGTVGNPVPATCDSEGLCTVRGLPAGRLTLRLDAGGEGMALVAAAMPGPEVQVRLRPVGVLRITAPPDEAGVTWKVRIHDPGTLLVLPVDRWRNPGGSEWVPVPASGLSVGVPEGSWIVEAMAPDGSSESGQAVVAAGQPGDVTFGAEPGS